MSRHDLGGSRAPKPGLGQPVGAIAVGAVGPGRRDDEVPAEPASVEPCVPSIVGPLRTRSPAYCCIVWRLDEDGDAGGIDEGHGREVDD